MVTSATLELRDELQATGKRIYCLAFTPRSGSTALAHDLAECGLGFPVEPFQPQLYLPEFTGRSVAAHIVDLVRSAPGEFFGFKIAWAQAVRLSRALSDEGISVAGPDLRSVLPGLSYLQIVRQDKLAQAVSGWRARTSGKWHQPVGETRSASPEEHGATEDLDMIRTIFLQYVAEDWLWQDFARRVHIQMPVLTYEKYVEDRLATLRQVATVIDGQPPRTVPPSRTEVMADHRSAELVEKLRTLLDDTIDPWWALSAVPGSNG